MAEGYRVGGRFVTGVTEQFRVGEIFFEPVAAAEEAAGTHHIHLPLMGVGSYLAFCVGLLFLISGLAPVFYA